MLHLDWQAAMKTEYDALLTNSTRTLVPKPVNKLIIGCKWIYKLKLKVDGSVDRFKARLVAKGFNQTYGIDYFETFCSVVKPTTIQIVLSLAISHGWLVKQLDVNNGFLNALYGMKQAPRAWFTELKNFTKPCSLSDSSMFLFRKGTDMIIILIYVDDIIVIGSNTVLVHQVVSSLYSQFALKDLGILNYFLGVEVCWQGSSLHLSQTKYIKDLLTRAGLADCKAIATLMTTSHTFSASEGSLLADPSQYRNIVGALQYCTITRPDISFSVNKLCQFMQSPTDLHWQAVKRLLRYLKGTTSFGLSFHSSSDLQLTAYADADWLFTSHNLDIIGNLKLDYAKPIVAENIVAKAICDSAIDVIWDHFNGWMVSKETGDVNFPIELQIAFNSHIALCMNTPNEVV
ncbi:Retrovirus-related Pol polyprotein from transposon RE1 [Vitis vinifera]|uniref:Retrovirus-related Pol polyprotein from transposon RE1 n=1 Tax=Vitis vinifera TaxID=29760 RepID=A0A438GZ59_VITVI|nr:Retrovirus-related Pol polyprotein from transposon RE1 [Vitis vinifera]